MDSSPLRDEDGSASTSASTEIPMPLEPPRFPPEIPLAIFEELQESSTIAALRQVSKAFNTLATPILYRHVVVTDQVVSCYGPASTTNDVSHRRICCNIRQHTKSISINQAVNHKLFTRLLNSLKSLQEIRWSCWGKGQTLIPQEIQEILAPALQARWPELRLCIEGIDTCMFASAMSTLIMSNISNIVSLKTDIGWLSVSDATTRQFKKMVLANRSLSTLHLTVQTRQARRIRWDAQPNERLPPLKELLLQGCDWPFDASSAVQFWDWTRITHLDLSCIPMTAFMRTVTPLHLRTLRTFKTDGSHVMRVYDETDTLFSKLLQGIANLSELSLKARMYTPAIAAALVNHAASLRRFEYKSYAPLDSPNWLPLHLRHLQELSNTHTDLRDLTIDMLPELKSPWPEALIIGTFRNLRRLHITTQEQNFTACGVEEGVKIGIRSFFQSLIAAKHGAAFESIIVCIGIGGQAYDFGYFGDSVGDDPRILRRQTGGGEQDWVEAEFEVGEVKERERVERENSVRDEGEESEMLRRVDAGVSWVLEHI